MTTIFTRLPFLVTKPSVQYIRKETVNLRGVLVPIIISDGPGKCSFVQVETLENLQNGDTRIQDLDPLLLLGTQFVLKSNRFLYQ